MLNMKMQGLLVNFNFRTQLEACMQDEAVHNSKPHFERDEPVSSPNSSMQSRVYLTSLLLKLG